MSERITPVKQPYHKQQDLGNAATVLGLDSTLLELAHSNSPSLHCSFAYSFTMRISLQGLELQFTARVRQDVG
jgi:hypothetical protein